MILLNALLVAMLCQFCEATASRDVLYADNNDRQNEIVHETDSLNIRFIGQCNTPGYACQVYVAGLYAYVADYYYGLRIIDVSDPAAPIEISGCDSVSDAVHVVICDTFAYVASHAHGMYCVDVSDPYNPTVAGHFPAWSTFGIFNVDVDTNGTVRAAYAITSQC